MNLPSPIAICIEDLQAKRSADQYLRCVAVPGGLPGLTVTSSGRVLWKSDDAAACELWVTADDRLALVRRVGAPPLTVTRAGRSLEAPEDKPVILADQDTVVVSGRAFRIHIHGPTTQVHKPSPLVEDNRTAVAAIAAALAISTSIGCSNKGVRKDVEVRDMPPSPPMVLPPEGGIETDAATDASNGDASESGADAADGADAGADAAIGKDGGRDAGREAGVKPQQQPVEVRHHPPKPVSRDIK